ncbi:histidine kinase [Streptomyces sp. NBC_00138]|nr:histidine kinase [Streptomyces sp. NBC_00223]
MGRGPRVSRNDVALAALVLAVEAALAVTLPESAVSHHPDLLGWALLVGSAATLAWRRRAPMWCLVGMVACVAPYHAMGNTQTAPILSSVVALYALAVAGPPVRTYLVVPSVVLTMSAVMSTVGKPHAGGEMLQSAGWIVAVAVVGEVVRTHRNYVAAIMERAERAERTREEEAARRVAEERLRIARDLHDLLAHSITLIGVQTSVAAHILLADPDRLDRTAVAGALDTIAATCREARAELRTTLRVLRADGDGPLPDLAGIPALAKAAEAAGARVELTMDGTAAPGTAAPDTGTDAPDTGTDAPDTGTDAPDTGTAPAHAPVPPAVGAAAYRIVQESLTNAVRHAGAAAGPRISVRVDRTATALRLRIVDDGSHAVRVPSPRPEGFGIAGMRERARSVGGTLTAGPRPDAPGFAVTAELPLTAEAPRATEPPPTPPPTPPLAADHQGDPR